MFTTWLAVPLYLEEVRGHEVRISGVILEVMSALFATFGPVGVWLADRRGRRLPMMAGALCLVVGVALVTGALGTTSFLAIAGALALMGVGLGLPDAATQEADFEPIADEHTGSAGGVYTTIRYLGPSSVRRCWPLSSSTRRVPARAVRSWPSSPA